jgi:hypothetical protein
LEDIDIDGEDNTKIELQEVEWGRGLDWSGCPGQVAVSCEHGSELLRSWHRASLMYSCITNKMQRYAVVFITINALHVLGGSFVRHQELKTVHAASGNCRAKSHLTHDSGKKQKKLDKCPMLCIHFWAPDDGRRNRVKHIEVL